jgi:hypothetical protein
MTEIRWRGVLEHRRESIANDLAKTKNNEG